MQHPRGNFCKRQRVNCISNERYYPRKTIRRGFPHACFSLAFVILKIYIWNGDNMNQERRKQYKNIGAELTIDFYAQVETRAKALGMSKSELVRQALMAYMSNASAAH